MSKEVYNTVSNCRQRVAVKAVLKELAWFANNDGENIWPSVSTLAHRTGLGRRGVQKILRELEQAGAIEAVGSRLGGRHRPTHYRLVLPWIEAHCDPGKDGPNYTGRANSDSAKGERCSPIGDTCEQKKGERHDMERANPGAQKGERPSHEQKEHEYEQTKNKFSNERKEPQAVPYEQQRMLHQAKAAFRGKAFPRPVTKEEARAQLAELAKRFPPKNGSNAAD
jgi:hypothetical protein